MRKYLNCVWCGGDLPANRRKYCSDECIKASGRIPNHVHNKRSIHSAMSVYRPASAAWAERRARIIEKYGVTPRAQGR